MVLWGDMPRAAYAASPVTCSCVKRQKVICSVLGCRDMLGVRMQGWTGICVRVHFQLFAGAAHTCAVYACWFFVAASVCTFGRCCQSVDGV